MKAFRSSAPLGFALLGAFSFSQPASSQTTLDDRLPVTDGFVWTFAQMGDVLYLGGVFTQLRQATGGFVPLDPVDGRDVPPYPRVTGSVAAIEPDGEGGYYIGGDFSHVGSMPRSNLARVRADGTLDPWAPQVDDAVRSLELADDVLYVGGEFEAIGPVSRFHLAAFDRSTGDLLGWNPSADGSVECMAFDGGVLFIGGYFSSVYGQSRRRIAALDAATGAATPWSADVTDTHGAYGVRDLLVLGDMVYVVGSFVDIGGASRVGAAALDKASGAVTEWNPNPMGSVHAIATGRGLIYLAGRFEIIGGKGRRRLAAVHPVTGAVEAWNPSCSGHEVNALAYADGVVYVGGNFYSIGGVARSNAAAVDADTGLLTSWLPQPADVVDVLMVDAGKVLAGGIFAAAGTEVSPRAGLAAVDLRTGATLPWDPNPALGSVFQIVASDGHLYVSGTYSRIGGREQRYLAEIDPVTGAATDWSPVITGSAWCVAARDGVVYAGGGFYAVNGVPRQSLAAIDAETGELTPWNPGAGYGHVHTLAFGKDVLYVAGVFDEVGGQLRSGLASVDLATGQTTGFAPEPDRRPHAVIEVGDVVYVAGEFTSCGGQPRNHIAAVDRVTGAATVWDPHANEDVLALAHRGDVVFAGGVFTGIGGEPRARLAALDVQSGKAIAWDVAPPNSPLRALYWNGSHLAIGGHFTVIAGEPHGGFGVLYEDGPTSVDPERVRSTAPRRQDGLRLQFVGPSPARAEVTVRFSLPAARPVRVSVHDVSGRMVRLLSDGPREAGEHVVRWDGSASDGTRIAAGIYFLRVTDGRVTESRKVVVQR